MTIAITLLFTINLFFKLKNSERVSHAAAQRRNVKRRSAAPLREKFLHEFFQNDRTRKGFVTSFSASP